MPWNVGYCGGGNGSLRTNSARFSPLGRMTTRRVCEPSFDRLAVAWYLPGPVSTLNPTWPCRSVVPCTGEASPAPASGES